MNYDTFINKYLGRSIDWDGHYGAQCVDSVAQYCIDNGKAIAYANAKDWWVHPALHRDFDFIANNPYDANQVPKRGDIVIFSGAQPGSGGYGHINIFDMVTGRDTWQGLDQNWGGQYVRFIPNHVWTYVIGWMSPKAPPAPALPVPVPPVAVPAVETPAPPSFPAPVEAPDPVATAPDPVVVIEPPKDVPTTTTTDPVTKEEVTHSAPPKKNNRLWIYTLIISLLGVFVKKRK